jgi:hypothetical protein
VKIFLAGALTLVFFIALGRFRLLSDGSGPRFQFFWTLIGVYSYQRLVNHLKLHRRLIIRLKLLVLQSSSCIGLLFSSLGRDRLKSAHP